ncbi:MAG: hypothetical protein Q4D19_10825 [Lautropia sp.]|nr:hypothetical protein [Lautropia sp.]
MFKHKNHGTSLRTPMTIAALSILLAACGGGGGSDDTQATSGRSSSAASGNAGAAATSNTTVNVAANNAAPAAGGATAPGSANTNTPANGAAGSGTTPAPETPRGTEDGAAPNNAAGNTPAGPVAAISAQGVRGDVVLAIMDQNACRSPDVYRTNAPLGTALGNTNDDTTSIVYRAEFNDLSSYSYDHSKLTSTPARAPGWVYDCQPGVRSYSKPIKPGQYTFRMSSSPSYFGWSTTYYGNPSIKRGFNRSGVDYDVNVTENSVSFGASVKVSQQEDLGYLAANQTAHQAMTERKVEANFTAEAYSFQRNALIPFGTLREWRDGAGNLVRLMLIAGDAPDEARLCTETMTDLAKRLQCKSWRVPADWSWGKELGTPKGYVVDDRTVYPNETGHMYWSK